VCLALAQWGLSAFGLLSRQLTGAQNRAWSNCPAYVFILMNLNHAELLHTTALFLYVGPHSHHIVSPLVCPSFAFTSFGFTLSLAMFAHSSSHAHCTFFCFLFFVTLSSSPSLSPYRLSPTITCSPSLLHQEEIQWVRPCLSISFYLSFCLY